MNSIRNGNDILPVFDGQNNLHDSPVDDNSNGDPKLEEQEDDVGDEDGELFVYTTQRGHESCRYKGFAYRISSKTAEMKRWRCRREGCRGKLWTTSDYKNPEERDTHCHAAYDYGWRRRQTDVDEQVLISNQQTTQDDQHLDSNGIHTNQKRNSRSANNSLLRQNDVMLTDAIPLHLLASTFQVNLNQDDPDIALGENRGLNEDFNLDANAATDPSSLNFGLNRSQNDVPPILSSQTNPRSSGVKRKRQSESALAKQRQQQDLVDKSEFILALMGTQENPDGRRLERFLGDIVEKLASIKEALDREDHNRLRCVIGQFMEIPVLLNNVVELFEKQRQQDKKRRIVADVLKRMGPAAGMNRASFRLEPEVASTSSLTSDELDNQPTSSW